MSFEHICVTCNEQYTHESKLSKYCPDCVKKTIIELMNPESKINKEIQVEHPPYYTVSKDEYAGKHYHYEQNNIDLHDGNEDQMDW